MYNNSCYYVSFSSLHNCFLCIFYRDQFPRKDQVISKEDLDQQLDQFMSHTKQKRDEELNRVIQEHS